MDAHVDSSRMTTIERLLKANAVSRMELLAAQDEEARVQLIELLPTAALQEMLNLEVSQDLEDHDLVRAEADRRLQWYLSQSDDELATLDVKTKSDIGDWMDRSTWIKFANRVTFRGRGNIMSYQMVEGLNYNVVMTHARCSPPSIDELLTLKPYTRRAAIAIQTHDVQSKLLDALPTMSKSEMLLDWFRRILDRNIYNELSARNAHAE